MSTLFLLCSGELIHEFIAAMYKHMTVRELAASRTINSSSPKFGDTYPAEELALEIPLVPK